MHAAEQRVVAEQGERAFAHSTGLRVVGVTILELLAGAMTLAAVPGWAIHLVPLSVYLLIAVLLFWARRVPQVRRLGSYSYLFDVMMIFVLQYRSLPTDPFPAGTAYQTLGLMAVAITLAATSIQGRATVATAALAVPLQVAVMYETGIGAGEQVAAVLVLVLIAFSGTGSIRRLREMVSALAALEVAHRLETQRVGDLERARSTIEQMLEQAREQNEQLKALQADKEVLTSLVVHDLRSPLAAVKSNLAWLNEELRSSPDPDVHDAIGDSLALTVRMNGMVADLLNISRLEASAFPLHRERISSRALLNEVRAVLEPQGRGRQLRVSVEASDFSVDGDRGLMLRTLENLGSNALRYTPSEGRIQLEARRAPGWVEIFVRNDGPVIPLTARGGLFDKFVQADEPKANRRSGWGLGLYFCRLCAEAHGGSIAVVDEPGWSTSFVVRLPNTGTPLPQRLVS